MRGIANVKRESRSCYRGRGSVTEEGEVREIGAEVVIYSGLGQFRVLEISGFL